MPRFIVLILAIPSIALAQSPGEIAGQTQYDLQDNGSGTNRIVMTSDGGVYVCWMKSESYPFPRNEYWNYRTPHGSWFGEVPVSSSYFAGYGCIDTGPDDCIALFCHALDDPRIHVSTTCNGSDDHLLPDADSFWPKAAVAPGGRFHVISGRIGNETDIVILYSTSIDYGETWMPWTRVDSLRTYIWTLNSSNISERTAIVEGIPVPGEYGQFDIGYIISEDGINWDFSDRPMITDYGGSRVSAYADADLIFDNDDYLHVVWNTFVIPEPDSEFSNASTLWHWSEETGQISQIAFFNHVSCEPGVLNLALCRMSLGVDSDDDLFCVWTGFASGDASDSGYCNGDLYVSYSVDGGLTWSARENVTSSETPGCAAGDCDSDNWATIVETVDDNLHVFYVNDKDAGAAPFEEGGVTDNPVRYLEVPNPARTAVDETGILPETIDLFTIYPNPFNAATTIRFELSEQSAIKLEIFDIAGRLVETLADRELPAGENSVIWDAGKRPSGIYFARLTAGSSTSSTKLVLLK